MVCSPVTREQLEEVKQHFASEGKSIQKYAMAIEIIVSTLGSEWWNRHFWTKPDPYLKTDPSSRSEQFHRVIMLAHMLYALRDANGYEQFIETLKTRGFDSGEIFELHVATMLQRSGFVVSFVEETGQKGEDYDLHVTKNDILINVEVKRRRSPSFSKKTLQYALNEARRQMPPDGPGIIFVAIPAEWTHKAGTEEIAANCIQSLFRNTGRVNSVVLVWHNWINLESGGRASISWVQQHDNTSPYTTIEG